MDPPDEARTAASPVPWIQRRPVGRAEVDEALVHWEERRWNASQLKAWVETVRAPGDDGDGDGDAIVKEVLAEVDLLEVSLLTRDDVPALRVFLHAASLADATRDWALYKSRIDLDARSKALRRDRFYRPFCR